ncbi:hypothetical protein [Novosphingopyxis sp. YJ-S2-01]|uniref:hypothetical protein n=1 Tax=Novosphingopyxis sp. YJ-S2-01 TaxID=2794021 RepID=UPI0018DCE25B|nr:hypothetical protein [Novosphingopyxis sp. YJ-S2-01]MBH9537877.1 hypothetical protein [Novosphingopyxis sp. YJ-S2-01]
MTGLAIGAALGFTQHKRSRSIDPNTGASFKIWRESFNEGEREHTVWKPIAEGDTRKARRWCRKLLRCAREMEVKTRSERQAVSPKARNGMLGGAIGLDVLEYLLLEAVRYSSGKLEPAVATIAAALGYSYSATHRALSLLREAGFIRWIRRTRPTGSREGPQIEQIPNAYELLVPAEATAIVKAYTEGTMERDAHANWYSWLKTLVYTAPKPARLSAKSSLEQALARLGSSLERESSTRREC